MLTVDWHVKLVYGGRPLVPEEKYDGSIYVLNLRKYTKEWFCFLEGWGWSGYKSIDAKQWTRVQLEGPQPSERSGHSVATQDNAMFIFGGQKEGHYFSDLHVFNTNTCKVTLFSFRSYWITNLFLNYTVSSKPRWEQINYNNKAGDCPKARSGHVSAIFDNKLYM